MTYRASIVLSRAEVKQPRCRQQVAVQAGHSPDCQGARRLPIGDKPDCQGTHRAPRVKDLLFFHQCVILTFAERRETFNGLPVEVRPVWLPRVGSLVASIKLRAAVQAGERPYAPIAQRGLPAGSGVAGFSCNHAASTRTAFCQRAMAACKKLGQPASPDKEDPPWI
jgi:hypothetical protein